MTDIRPFGDAALHVDLGVGSDPGNLARVHALAARVVAERIGGEPWGTPVPGMASLLIPFDPGSLSGAEAAERLAMLMTGLDAGGAPRATTPRTHRIAVRYGGDDGPDLVAVAERLGITTDRVVELHGSMDLRVAILGFMPGFGYLGDLPAELHLPRRATPRTRVPAGSVAIAGRHTGVYPFATPGGWHLIGRTETRLWDVAAEPPALLRPGDLVRFEPVA